MRSLAALCLAFFSVTSAIAHEQDQTSRLDLDDCYKAERFGSCTMSRSADNLNITFVRSRRLAPLLDSSKWKPIREGV